MIDIFLFVLFIFLFYILHVPGAGTEYLVCSEELAIYEIFVDFRLQYFLSPSKISMSLSVQIYQCKIKYVAPNGQQCHPLYFSWF